MYLGLDLGTSGLRALLVDGQGAIIGTSEAAYTVQHPHAGWSEQDPLEWTAACDRAVETLRAQVPTAFSKLPVLCLCKDRPPSARFRPRGLSHFGSGLSIVASQ